MTNEQKLEHALAFGYPVKVVWDKHSIQSQEEGMVFHTMLNGFKFHGDDHKYDYAYIVSVEPLEPEVEKAEDVYEYICGKLREMPATWPIAGEIGWLLSQAREKYGHTAMVDVSIADARRVMREAFELDSEMRTGAIDRLCQMLVSYINSHGVTLGEVAANLLEYVLSDPHDDAAPESQSEILDEEWHIESRLQEAVCDDQGNCVDQSDWLDEFSALPDALRALKAIGAKLRAVDRAKLGQVFISLYPIEVQDIDQVLKKAGIE